MPNPIFQAFIRGDELLVESYVLDEFGQPSRVLQRRAPVSPELRAALDAQLVELDAEQESLEAKARTDIAAGKKLDAPPAADLLAKVEKARRVAELNARAAKADDASKIKAITTEENTP